MAYFEVAKDEEKPFVVKLNKQDITVWRTKVNRDDCSGSCLFFIT